MFARVFCVITLSGILGPALLSCNPSDEHPIAEASGGVSEGSDTTSDVPIESLGSLDKVFVPLDPASLQSLDDALEQKGYGNVKGSDFVPRFHYVEASFGPAVVAYTNTGWIASQSMYQPMTVTQWLEASLDDEAAGGAVINPGHPGQILALSKSEITEVMACLQRQLPLPMEIYVTQ